MRIAVLGGGPAGLYFSQLWKSRHPLDDVTVFEQNGEGATFGFGVVFYDQALDFLTEMDAPTAQIIRAKMQRWRDMTLVHQGVAVTIDGIGFSSIGRLELLAALKALAGQAGVQLKFNHPIFDMSQLDDYDLIIATDGINSLARRAFATQFGAQTTQLAEKFAWFGTTKPFDTLTQTFVQTPFGAFNAHHYRYAPDKSTFIVECEASTWVKAGLDKMGETQSKHFCEGIFAHALCGHSLIANQSQWRNFPFISNENWFYQNIILLGDALHTAHYSIGSGTRMALEDGLALVSALEAHPNSIQAAFSIFRAAREPQIAKLVQASKKSANWYGDIQAYMPLAPYAFALSYISRSGYVDNARLRQMSPKFMTQYDRRASQMHPK